MIEVLSLLIFLIFYNDNNIIINNNLLESQLDFNYSSNVKYDPPRYNINLFRHNTFEYNSSLYDNYCTELYGKKTCILFQMKEQFEVRMMDKQEKKQSLHLKMFYICSYLILFAINTPLSL